MDTIREHGLVIGAAAMSVVSFISDYSTAMTRRTTQLRVAAKALGAHYDALEKFTSDPAVSDNLRQFVLDFSDAVTDEGVARVIAQRICSDDPPPTPSAAAAEITSEVDELRRTRRDLIPLFDAIIGNGITAMFHQWDSTAAMVETALQKFTANPGREIVVAAKAVTAERKAKSTRVHEKSRLVPA
jgi:hypothetical protein